MSAVREAIILPALLLTVTLLGGLDPGALAPWRVPGLLALVLAVLVLGVLVRSGALAPELLLHSSRPILANTTGMIVLVALFAASAQALHMLIPRSGLPALIVGLVLLLMLVNTWVALPDRPRLLRSLAVVLGSAFLLKFVVLAALADPEGGRTRRVLVALFDLATLGTISQDPLHPSAGYIAFFVLLLYLAALALLPVRRAGTEISFPSMDNKMTRAFVLFLFIWAGAATSAAAQSPQRPFGTLREQAEMQQAWLKKRLDTFLPALMRKHAIDMWVIPMREYAEDPVFKALVAPETFAARRRTIYVFFDKCAGAGTAPSPACVERIALGGSSQGGVFEARRSTKQAAGDVGRGQQAELWGDEQWQALKAVIEERKPRVIGINRSTVFAFSDGLTSGELQGMSAALGEQWTSKFKNAEGLPLELIAVRLPEEEAFFEKMNALVWSLTQEMFSAKTITPGKTKTSDLVWWWRERVNQLGLDTWFQPSISVQRRGQTAEQLSADPVIQRGDVLHCDVGITVARLNTDTQHNAYVLAEGETDAPEGLRRALLNSNVLQDITVSKLRPGRTGNEILASSLAQLKAKGINGTLYSHAVGLHGHGAGPLIGLWDYQDGVPGRGDAKVIPSMWYSIELQTTTPVPEWGGQPVRIAQEEDVIIDAAGKVRWAHKRQDKLFLITIPNR